MYYLTIQLWFTNAVHIFDDITVLSDDITVSTWIIFLESFIEIIFNVGDMLKNCSLV